MSRIHGREPTTATAAAEARTFREVNICQGAHVASQRRFQRRRVVLVVAHRALNDGKRLRSSVLASVVAIHGRFAPVVRDVVRVAHLLRWPCSRSVRQPRQDNTEMPAARTPQLHAARSRPDSHARLTFSGDGSLRARVVSSQMSWPADPRTCSATRAARASCSAWSSCSSMSRSVCSTKPAARAGRGDVRLVLGNVRLVLRSHRSGLHTGRLRG